MTNITLSRPSLLLVSAVVLACNPGPKMGGSDTEASTGTTTDSAQLVCGEGEIEWIHAELGSRGKGARALGVTVDTTGRIIVIGAEVNDEGHEEPLLLVLDPTGAEVWRKPITTPNEPDHLHDVVADDSGRIYIGGRERVDGEPMAYMVRAFTADGDALWNFSETGVAPELGAAIGGLALGHGALYSAGTERLDTLVVRRHDLTTGEAVWKTSHGEGIEQVDSAAIAVVGANVVATARAAFGGGAARPFVLQLDSDGAITSATVDEQRSGWWTAVHAIGGDGEQVLVGESFSDGVSGISVQRAGLDGAEVWSTFFDPSPSNEQPWGAAVAADERILVVGTTQSDDLHKQIPSVRCLAGDGTSQWQAPFAFNDEEYETDNAYGGAFGPGFMVVVGSQQETRDKLWVRKYLID